MSGYYIASSIDSAHTAGADTIKASDDLLLFGKNKTIAVRVSGRRFERIVKTLRSAAVPHRIETDTVETTRGPLRKPELRPVTVLFAAEAPPPR